MRNTFFDFGFRHPLPIILTAFAIGLWAAATCAAADTWQKDPARYHASAHGTLSCTDCHSDVDPTNGHPDPARVNRKAVSAFDPESCYDCHGDVAGDMDDGVHAGRAVPDRARFERCVRCHDPHAALPVDLPDGYERGLPVRAQCGACHDPEDALPEPAPDQRECLACHAAPEETLPPSASVDRLCLSCHGKAPDTVSMTALAGGREDLGPHKAVNCLSCHPGADRYPHLRQGRPQCLSCHEPHGETAAGDAHIGVECQACHAMDVTPVRPTLGGPVLAKAQAGPEGTSRVHRLTEAQARESCRRCHQEGNTVGAAAMVPPAKGLLCLPCHSGTIGLPGWPSRIGFVLFLVGLAGAAAFWLGGPPAGSAEAANHASGRFRCIAAALFLDGLCQRRLWKTAPLRGLIHAMIFWPFIIRFLWGILTLVLNVAAPETPLARLLVDKNHPLTALAFDLTGLSVLAGAGLAMLRRLAANRSAPATGMPRPDWTALGLLFGIIVVGFSTEAVRIAMTGAPEGAGWALIGYPLSRAVVGAHWLETGYGWLWYLHAVLVAAFVAYLPFGRMFHIITAPVVLAIRASSGRHHAENGRHTGDER